MLLQFGRAGVDKGLWIEHRCIIDEGVELAETPQRFRHDPCPGGAVGYVVVKKQGGVAEFGCDCLPRSWMSVIATRAPSATNSLASASPCPPAAPVMIATLPLSRPTVFSSASRSSAMALNPFAIQIPYDIRMSNSI